MVGGLVVGVAVSAAAAAAASAVAVAKHGPPRAAAAAGRVQRCISIGGTGSGGVAAEMQ